MDTETLLQAVCSVHHRNLNHILHASEALSMAVSLFNNCASSIGPSCLIEDLTQEVENDTSADSFFFLLDVLTDLDIIGMGPVKIGMSLIYFPALIQSSQAERAVTNLLRVIELFQQSILGPKKFRKSWRNVLACLQNLLETAPGDPLVTNIKNAISKIENAIF
ncbi:unnamed protein product [Phytomonas sp. Hart1]|nr:unnamed protein product [Phytomonas sp. Hart1]|eukprot:CCW70115.1 unnamed protein product [Phytomonas sp. isolate Hart1]